MTSAAPQAQDTATSADRKNCTVSESELERAISAANARLCAAQTREEKLQHWREMVRLIDQRTPHYVRFLERTRGLA